MRTDGPSRTARGVAARRLALSRPSTPTGDPDAEDRLARDVVGDPSDVEATDARNHWVAARTPFFDAEVVSAIGAGIRQIVLVGAGYDGRALRFRTPGVTFFEVDHPLTQLDKRERLANVGARTEDIVFVAADFMKDDIDAALGDAGHDPWKRTLFVCEGVLRYLTEDALLSLLRRLAARAAPGSELAVSITTREEGAEDPDLRRARELREAKLAEGGEAVLTVPPRVVALGWLSTAGWIVAPDAIHDSGDGRLLVRATR